MNGRQNLSCDQQAVILPLQSYLDIIDRLLSLAHLNEAQIQETFVFSMQRDVNINRNLLLLYLKGTRCEYVIDKKELPYLVGINIVMEQTDPSAWTPDDLLPAFVAIVNQFYFVLSYRREDQVLAHLETLSHLLNVMLRANLPALSQAYYDPLNSVLKRLERSSHPRISYFARYAREALIRISNDESELAFAIRQGSKAAKTAASVYATYNLPLPSHPALLSTDTLSSCYQVLSTFQDIASSIPMQSHWYDQLNTACSYLTQQKWHRFCEYTRYIIGQGSHPHFRMGIILALHRFIELGSFFPNQSVEVIQAVDYLSELFSRCMEADGSQGTVAKEVLNALKLKALSVSRPSQQLQLFPKRSLMRSATTADRYKQEPSHLELNDNKQDNGDDLSNDVLGQLQIELSHLTAERDDLSRLMEEKEGSPPSQWKGQYSQLCSQIMDIERRREICCPNFY